MRIFNRIYTYLAFWWIDFKAVYKHYQICRKSTKEQYKDLWGKKNDH